MNKRVIRNLIIVIAAAFAATFATACGGESPTSPTPVTPSIAGSWTGNVESSNFDTRAVDVSFSQAGSSVTGTWTNASSDWNGTLSGTISGSTFTGTFTISAPNFTGIGSRCTGNASVSGPVGATPTTLRWTSSGFSGSCNGMPANNVWNLQRR